MAKKKRGKGTNNGLQNTTQKIKKEQYEPHKTTGGEFTSEGSVITVPINRTDHKGI